MCANNRAVQRQVLGGLLLLSVLFCIAVPFASAQNPTRKAMAVNEPVEPKWKEFTISIDAQGTLDVSDPAILKSSPQVESVLKALAGKLGPRIARTAPEAPLTLRFKASGDLGSSNQTIFDPYSSPAKYEDYKKCVGDTWWAPVLAQILCLPALWVY